MREISFGQEVHEPVVRKSRPPKVPDDAVEFRGHWYKNYSTPLLSWHKAKKKCESLGGYLVSITSRAERDFVHSIAGDEVWIGATDEKREGRWKRVSGERWSYTSWNSGQPGGKPSDADYAYFRKRNPNWNDSTAPEHNRAGWICEWE
jgi:hypothetical protein